MELQQSAYSIPLRLPYGPVNPQTGYMSGANRVDTAVWFDQRRFTTSGLIKALIRSSDERRGSALVQQIRMELGSKLGILAEIAVDGSEMINVRAQAARLFVAQAHAMAEFEKLIDSLANHSSAMIRLGALHGFADAEDWERVRMFWADAHASVVEEAADLLAAHDDESR